MAKYTTQVRSICEYYAGLTESKGYNDVDSIVEAAAPSIFPVYPIFDEAYRTTLNKKILKHYYMREIGEETVGLFKLRLDTTMNEIMPYYNQLYESALLKFDPLTDVDLTTDKNRAGVKSEVTKNSEVNESTGNEVKESTVDSNENGVNVQRGSAESEDWEKYSDTPQGSLSDIANNTYLTNATNNTSESSNQSVGNQTKVSNDKGSEVKNATEVVGKESEKSGSVSNLEDYIEHIKGKRSGITYSKMLLEFRETLLNIDMMIIDELKDLFFKLW